MDLHGCKSSGEILFNAPHGCKSRAEILFNAPLVYTAYKKIFRAEDDMEAWYPPCHGDFYESFAHSGLLQEFLQKVSYTNYKSVAKEVAIETISVFEKQIFMNLSDTYQISLFRAWSVCSVFKGKTFCFLSNSDNLGATVDLNILNLCMAKQHEFIMEVGKVDFFFFHQLMA